MGQHAASPVARTATALGKKPLYYWSDGITLSSPARSRHCWPIRSSRAGWTTEPSPAYLTFGYVPTPRTFFEGITSVPPGHVLVVRTRGCTAASEQYWEPVVPGLRQVWHQPSCRSTRRPAPSGTISPPQWSDGWSLTSRSGPSLAAASTLPASSRSWHSLMNQPVATFTIGFEDTQGFDERPYARLVAERFKTNHTEFVVSPDAASLVERLVWHYDQPFGDSSALPTYLLSELTRKHVTVALCGDGGDELFAGYERFAAALALARVPTAAQSLSNVGSAGAGRATASSSAFRWTREEPPAPARPQGRAALRVLPVLGQPRANACAESHVPRRVLLGP